MTFAIVSGLELGGALLLLVATALAGATAVLARREVRS